VRVERKKEALRKARPTVVGSWEYIGKSRRVFDAVFFDLEHLFASTA
jgi:hypothetical protein|tara:strand:- start:240 stop:380 length:141 start_codon:yes stop_codon:yes gene_type:complete